MSKDKSLRDALKGRRGRYRESNNTRAVTRSAMSNGRYEVEKAFKECVGSCMKSLQPGVLRTKFIQDYWEKSEAFKVVSK